MYLQSFRKGTKREAIAARLRKYGKITHFRMKKITGWQDGSIEPEVYQITRIWGVEYYKSDSTYILGSR